MTAVLWACGVALAAAVLVTAAFVVHRRGIVDRAVGLDMTVAVLLNGLALAVVARRGGDAVDLVLLISLLGFLGTVTVSRFVERRGLGPPPTEDGT